MEEVLRSKLNLNDFHASISEIDSKIDGLGAQLKEELAADLGEQILGKASEVKYELIGVISDKN